MIFSVLVLGAPYSSGASYSAYRFAQAALDADHNESHNKNHSANHNECHTIHRIFFYQDGIHSSSQLATPPQDEFNLYQAWQDLQSTYDLDLVTCIAAAVRRGVIDSGEAKRHNKLQHNMSTNFSLSGLGQLVEANALSDRVITFGR